MIVVLSLPEKGYKDIKVFNEVKIEDLTQTGGLQVLIAFFDKHLKTADLAGKILSILLIVKENQNQSVTLLEILIENTI